MIVSSNQPYEFDRLSLLEIAKNNPSNYLVDELSVDEHFYEKSVDVSKAPIITDQRNPLEIMINPITSVPYEQEFQDKNIEENENREEILNLLMGVVLVILASIWLIYFRKKIWQPENLN